MKVKTLACLCALAAIPAFGTEAVTSANTFGVLKVECASQKVIIATPWVKCGDATSPVKVTDLVMTSGLETGDAILVYEAVRQRIAAGIDKVPEFIPWHGEGKKDK